MSKGGSKVDQFKRVREDMSVVVDTEMAPPLDDATLLKN